jgi:hypothetical protein
VTLRCVPEEKKQFVRSKLSAGHETDLLNQCWIPFGIESLLVTKEGGIFPLEPLTPEHRDDINRTFRMEVPANAIRSDTLEVMYGIILDGPFVLPRGYRFASPLVYVCFDESKVIKPLKIHIPHWIAQAKDHSEDDVLFIISPHSVSEGEQMYKFTAMESRCTSTLHDVYGTVEISGHNSLVGQAMEEKIPSCYYASLWEKIEGNNRQLKVAVTYKILFWLKVLKQFWKEWSKCYQHCPTFTFKKQLAGKLTASSGKCWTAILVSTVIKRADVHYGIHNSEKKMKMAVEEGAYPPSFFVEVSQNNCFTDSRVLGIVSKLTIEGTADANLCFAVKAEDVTEERATSTPSSNIQLNTPSLKHIRPGSPQRPQFHDLSPSDIGLSRTLEATAEWHNLAVNLGVPIGQVRAFKSDPLMGALLALKYWRDGMCGERFPSTWRFLLQEIETTFGGKVAKPLERKASGKPTWSQ